MKAPAAALAALMLLGSAAGPAAAQEDVANVTVTGEGSVAVAPDLAVVSSGVTTRAQTAEAALKANAAAMTKVLAAVKQAGVADRDVATSGLSVQPQYDYGDGSNPRPPRLVGYEVRNVVTIRSRAVDKAGDLVDALVQAGSNQIEGVSFDVAEKAGKLDEARRAAIADARRKATLFAEAAGVRLGPAYSIEETASGSDEPVRPMPMRAKAMDAAVATPIAGGEQELRVRVSVRWRIEG